MKKLSLALALLPFLASAQTVTPPLAIETVTTFSAGSIKHPEVSEVITQRVGILHNLFGIKGTYADWRVFGGFNFTAHNSPASGMTLAGYFPLAKEVTVGIGPVYEITQGNKPGVGLYVGFQFKLGN